MGQTKSLLSLMVAPSANTCHSFQCGCSALFGSTPNLCREFNRKSAQVLTPTDRPPKCLWTYSPFTGCCRQQPGWKSHVLTSPRPSNLKLGPSSHCLHPGHYRLHPHTKEVGLAGSVLSCEATLLRIGNCNMGLLSYPTGLHLWFWKQTIL